MTPERRAEILDAYLRYGSSHHAAYVTQSCTRTVCNVARMAGVLAPHSSVARRANLPEVDVLLRLLRKHRTHRAVARLFGCSVQTLRNRMYGRGR